MLQTLTGGATTLSVQSSCLAEMGKTKSNTTFKMDNKLFK